MDDAGGDVVGRDERDLGADAAEHVGRHEERSNDRHGDLVPPEALQVKLTPENRAGGQGFIQLLYNTWCLNMKLISITF